MKHVLYSPVIIINPLHCVWLQCPTLISKAHRLENPSWQPAVISFSLIKNGPLFPAWIRLVLTSPSLFRDLLGITNGTIMLPLAILFNHLQRSWSIGSYTQMISICPWGVLLQNPQLSLHDQKKECIQKLCFYFPEKLGSMGKVLFLAPGEDQNNSAGLDQRPL